MRPRARARKLAICARVTLLSGQYCSGSRLQPTVMPAPASASMFFAWLLPLTSANPADGADPRSNALTTNVAI